MVDFLPFKPKGEFSDRFGVTRKVWGCSTLGRELFFERLAELATRLSEAEHETFQQLFDWDQRIKYLVCECLTLNNIDPDWVTLDQVQTLLIGNGTQPGWLVQINRPKASQSPVKTEPLTLPQIIAAVSTHTGSIESAIKLVAELPADQLTEILEARNEQSAPPKEQAKAKMRRNKKKVLDDLSRITTAARETPAHE